MQLLTRLNAGTINLEGVSGGIPELTTADLSACLAGADHAGLDLLLKRVTGLAVAHNDIYKQVRERCLRLAVRNGWKITEKSINKILILLFIAIYEQTADIVCPSCRGTKYSQLRPSEHCATCHGSGKWRIADPVKAELIGISKQGYSQTWRYRYDDIKIMLDTREYLAKKSIFKLLSDA